MKIHILTATVVSLLSVAGTCLAQVPPDIAAGIRKIGPIVDTPNTVKLYGPLFEQQKEPYGGVSVARDLAYGPDPLNRIDVFTSGASPAGKTVLMFVHGGGFERGDKRQAGSPFYDNLMLWAVQQGMVGMNFNYRMAPKNTWPAAHDDMAAAVRFVQANAAQYGGDPNRLVLWGQSAGASLIAGYLAHPQFHPAAGHGVKAAVLNSGFYENDRGGSAYFGSDPKELKERSSVEGMKKLTTPLFISHTEVDLPDAITQADGVKQALCDAGRCPTYAVFKDHSHISQNYSVGTADVSVSGPILQFIRGVK
jgi:pimeloyl-ACP methyl ester carboxylesterase